MKILIAVFLFSLPLFALELDVPMPMFKITDQFARPVVITNQTKWLIFVADKKPAAILTDYLNEAKINLDAKKAILISDISRMPKLISKMVAIPEMKKYKFSLGLDQTGEETKSWPRDKDKVTLIEMSQAKVKQVQFIETKEEIVKFFTSP